MKKKYTKEATVECFGSFCIIIGVMSIIPAAIPMITDNNNVSMIISLFFVPALTASQVLPFLSLQR
jgi:hypothetical protein